MDARVIGAAHIALAGLLNLDDLRAEVAEYHTAVRPGQNARQIQHANALQWSSHAVPSCLLL